MTAPSMLMTANILLAITALGGLTMAIIRFTGADRPPSWLAMLHGLLAGSALTLLLYAGFSVGISHVVWAGLGLLVLTALGGVALNLVYHTKLLPLPKGIVIVHALLAVAGFGVVFAGSML